MDGIKTRGILYNSEMIRAILDGRKRQSSRPNGLEIINQQPDEWVLYESYPDEGLFYLKDKSGELVKIKCPWGKIRDGLYGREKALYWDGGAGGCSNIAYFDDPEIPDLLKDNDLLKAQREGHGKGIVGKWQWKSGRFMPQEFSRIHQIITDIRLHRVWDISLQDIQAEGITMGAGGGLDWTVEARNDFRHLWDSIYPKYKGVNIWMWALTTKLVKPDISQEQPKIQESE